MKQFNSLRLSVFFLLFLSIGCNGQDTDKVIDRYDNADFGILQGISIYRRSTDLNTNTSIYFVNMYGGKCSPYIVELNNIDKKIVEVKNNLVIKSCGKDYLSRKKIEQVINKYIQFNLCLIQVDLQGNVFVNPDRSDLPTLLRKSNGSMPSNISAFKLYKGNWYVKK